VSVREVVTQVFSDRFGDSPTSLVRAPGRVNLIGEHTDYNDGFVLPMAIDKSIWFAIRPRQDRTVILQSIDLDDTLQFDLNQITHTDSGWGEYIKGTTWALQEAGYRLQGWEGVFAGDIPIGAGLSSSAAIEVGTTRAFSAVSNFSWSPVEMAKIAQNAETQWVGLKCGIMDHLISAAGEEGHALLIDCRSLDLQPVLLPPEVEVIILDTKTRRGHVDSAYNERRAQCDAAAELFGVTTLRDVSLPEFTDKQDGLAPLLRVRARHVITENNRVQEAVKAMGRGDAHELGELLNKSHASLREDYEVSGFELDAIVESAQNFPGCFGARMTGAGFGGCAVAVIRKDVSREFMQQVGEDYTVETGLEPDIFIAIATRGAQVIQPA
jgi:galactokinase